MPLIRPGGATWSLTPTSTTFAAENNDDALSNPKTAGEKGEDTNQTTAQYTLAILERYLTTFDTFESASSPADGDTALFSEALERLSEHVTGDGMAACLICLEDVKPTDPVWQCCSNGTTTAAVARPLSSKNNGVENKDNTSEEDDSTFSSSGCYALLHLPCAQAWARQQIQQQQLKQQKSTFSSCWGCPKCRKLFAAVPSGYSCFCGKEENPVFNPWNVAHSCGEECGVENPLCGHPCMLLCHPGPHPPCPRVIPQASCFCGKEKTARRCGKQEFSCKAICGRKRIHGCDHPCPALCHPGECPPCIRLVTASCRCGSTTATEMRCSAAKEFRCEKICQKPLSCGIHYCNKVCCNGDCGPCPFSIGIKTCPCGKTEKEKIECGLTVPPCGQTCDKVLACGVHHCTERCHTGPCPQTCRTTVEKTCLCGRMTKTILCQETFKCERRCTEMKSCGRHPCKRRCCDGSNCPPCEEICNRRLRCGNHRCPAPCHPGECSPCPLSVKITCACGKTSYSTPCGRESTAQPPRCQLACSVPPVCRHREENFPPHRCHFGPCPGLVATKGKEKKVPPCPFPCGTALPCGHNCSVPCHDPPSHLDIAPFTPPPPPIAPAEKDVSKKRIELLNAPPAAVPAARAALAFIEEQNKNIAGSSKTVLSVCPPCGVMQKVPCLGGHTTASLPCCQASPFSCEKACGKLLLCGNHSCSLPCHDCSAHPCAQCTLSCQKQRPCKHDCPKTSSGGMCHPGECGDCQVEVILPCHCGKTSLNFPCHRTTTTGDIKSTELCCPKQCLRQLVNCPHLCDVSCHEGPCPGSIGRCEAETTVRCGCKRMKKKLKCFEVAALLEKERKKSGGGGGGTDSGGTVGGKYDAMTSLRLLPCDAECAKTVPTTTSTTTTTATTPSAAAPSLRLEGQKKRLLQDERAAETARKERDREQKRLEKVKQQKMQQLIRIVLLLGLFIFIFSGAFLIRRVVSTVDKAAQEKWKV